MCARTTVQSSGCPLLSRHGGLIAAVLLIPSALSPFCGPLPFRPSNERIRVPVLALFGADDPMVPVEASVTVYREAVQPKLLTVAVFPGADHRIQTGNPRRLADGYLETLTSFALQA